MVDLLPEIEVVEGDEFNSHPTDTKYMGPYALERYEAGEQLPVARIKTPLVRGCSRLKSCLAPLHVRLGMHACMHVCMRWLLRSAIMHLVLAVALTMLRKSISACMQLPIGFVIAGD